MSKKEIPSMYMENMLSNLNLGTLNSGSNKTIKQIALEKASALEKDLEQIVNQNTTMHNEQDGRGYVHGHRFHKPSMGSDGKELPIKSLYERDNALLNKEHPANLNNLSPSQREQLLREHVSNNKQWSQSSWTNNAKLPNDWKSPFVSVAKNLPFFLEESFSDSGDHSLATVFQKSKNLDTFYYPRNYEENFPKPSENRSTQDEVIQRFKDFETERLYCSDGTNPTLDNWRVNTNLNPLHNALYKLDGGGLSRSLYDIMLKQVLEENKGTGINLSPESTERKVRRATYRELRKPLDTVNPEVVDLYNKYGNLDDTDESYKAPHLGFAYDLMQDPNLFESDEEILQSPVRTPEDKYAKQREISDRLMQKRLGKREEYMKHRIPYDKDGFNYLPQAPIRSSVQSPKEEEKPEDAFDSLVMEGRPYQ